MTKARTSSMLCFLSKCGFLVAVYLCLLASRSFAFVDNSFNVGISYFSQGVPNKISTQDSGKSSFLGTTYLPFKLQYDWLVFDGWFFAPQLSYSFISRSLSGDTGKATMTSLVLPFGKNLESGSSWDWYVGPGLIQYEYKGAGGTKVMNNGTSTASFAIPGRDSTVKKITMNLGGSYIWGPSRLAMGLVFENFFSDKKRTQDLVLSYTYQLGGF